GRGGLGAGLMVAGFGGGTALFIPVIASIIKTSGYQAAFIYTGIFQAVVILVVAQFLCHPSAGLTPAKPSAGSTRGAGATRPPALAAATSWNALANGGSRIFWGWASDRIGRELAMGVAFS